MTDSSEILFFTDFVQFSTTDGTVPSLSLISLSDMESFHFDDMTI
jgi:hypothetical protein